jgi:phosphoserine phosphatase
LTKPPNSPFKIVIFDLDGVLVPIHSSWQHVHRALHVDNEENHRKYLQGQISYNEFMRSDIALWKNLHLHDLETILQDVPLANGARETLRTLHRRRVKTAIISSGISILAKRIGAELGIAHVHANDLATDEEGRLTGEAEATVPPDAKQDIATTILKEESIAPEQAAVVGDNILDIPPTDQVGLTIAYNAQDPKAEEKADVAVRGDDLRLILPWLTSGQPVKAFITLVTGEKEAGSIALALAPDNNKTPQGLQVRGVRQGSEVHLKITTVKGYRTMLATIDDLLSCAQVAVATINTAKHDRKMDITI